MKLHSSRYEPLFRAMMARRQRRDDNESSAKIAVPIKQLDTHKERNLRHSVFAADPDAPYRCSRLSLQVGPFRSAACDAAVRTQAVDQVIPLRSFTPSVS